MEKGVTTPTQRIEVEASALAHNLELFRSTLRRNSELLGVVKTNAYGYSRVLGNRLWVLIDGRSAPVVGRVCMNILMADVSDIPGVSAGEEIVLIGRQ